MKVIAGEGLTNYNKSRRKLHKIIDNTPYKQCSRCKAYKELDRFLSCRTTWDKLVCYCKECAALVYKSYKNKPVIISVVTDQEVISIEEIRRIEEHNKTLDWIIKVGYDKWYWDSLEI